MSKIGIVGGSGFIGSALARTLSKLFTIKILDIKPLPKDLEGELEYQQLNVKKYKEVERGLETIEKLVKAEITKSKA